MHHCLETFYNKQALSDSPALRPRLGVQRCPCDSALEQDDPPNPVTVEVNHAPLKTHGEGLRIKASAKR